MPERDPDHGEKLAKLEANIAALTANVEALSRDVGALTKAMGRPNYSMLSVGLAGVGLIGAVAATALFGPISNNAERIQETRTDLTGWIRDEQRRNNELEREMGARNAIDQLFMAGKLKLD